MDRLRRSRLEDRVVLDQLGPAGMAAQRIRPDLCRLTSIGLKIKAPASAPPARKPALTTAAPRKGPAAQPRRLRPARPAAIRRPSYPKGANRIDGRPGAVATLEHWVNDSRRPPVLIPVPLEPLRLPLPLLGRLVPAGFPSPADDHLDGEIDLGAYLIERPAATFLMRVTGESMVGAGIFDGDLLVVDRSVEAQSGHVVVAMCSGELTLKRLRVLRDGRAVLRAANPDYPEFVIREETPAEIWGVVVGVVRKTV
jgi:DNA polymerase V